MEAQHLPDQSFSAAQSELPMLYVFLGLAACELLVVHLLVSHWSSTAAWALSFMTLLFVLQFGMIVRSVKQRPTLVTDKALIVRWGRGLERTISWPSIAAIEGTGFGPAPSGPDVLRAALIAHPNVRITLRTPIAMRQLGRTRDVSTLALRVDNPGALIDAVQLALAGTSTMEETW